MIHHKAKAYKHSTRAAGLAAVTLSEYTDFLLLEKLVEPIDASPKSNRSSMKDAPKVKFCKVYPNPTSGILLVEVPTGFTNLIIRVLDHSGKLIYQERVLDGLNTINLRQVSSGSYMLSIRSEDGTLNESHAIQILK
jgi:hypothetical protein